MSVSTGYGFFPRIQSWLWNETGWTGSHSVTFLITCHQVTIKLIVKKKRCFKSALKGGLQLYTLNSLSALLPEEKKKRKTKS